MGTEKIAGLPLGKGATWAPYHVSDAVQNAGVSASEIPKGPECLHCSPLAELQPSPRETLATVAPGVMPSDLVAQVIHAVQVGRPVRPGLVVRLLRHAQHVEQLLVDSLGVEL